MLTLSPFTDKNRAKFFHDNIHRRARATMRHSSSSSSSSRTVKCVSIAAVVFRNNRKLSCYTHSEKATQTFYDIPERAKKNLKFLSYADVIVLAAAAAEIFLFYETLDSNKFSYIHLSWGEGKLIWYRESGLVNCI